MFRNKNYSDEELVKALQGNSRERHRALVWLSNNVKWQQFARKKVMDLGGREDQVDDIFNKSLAAFVNQVMRDKFKGDSAASSYFVSICRNQYLKLIRNKKDFSELTDTKLNMMEEGREKEWANTENNSEKTRIINSLLGRLKGDCAKILSLYGLNYTMDEIASEMGYSNKQTAKNNSGKCRKKLREMIWSDDAIRNRLRELI